MKPLSIEPVFAVVDESRYSRDGSTEMELSPNGIYAMIPDASFTEIYDMMRLQVCEMIEAGNSDTVVKRLVRLDEMIEADTEKSTHLLNVHAAVKQLLTAVYIETGQNDAALRCAAATLSLLASNPRRKDEPFLSVLASLLYDIAFLHSCRDEYKQAERELEKSMRILDKLARINPGRYGSPYIMALNATTSVYRNRERQAELLAGYQAATNTYLEMVKSGVADATERLIDSLSTEGETLARMGRYREAIQFYMRAIKLLTKVEPSVTTMRQLRLSIELGDAMLHIESMRDKAIHLLNTMLHKATKLNAAEEHRRIVDILAESRTRSLDILGLWHKIFPK